LMRVIHWHPNFMKGSGIANAVLGLAEAQKKHGAEVAIVAVESPETSFLESIRDRVKTNILTWRPYWGIRLGHSLFRIPQRNSLFALRKFEPDLIHIHGELSPDNFWVPFIFRCPIVVSPHGMLHPIVLEKSRKKIKRVYLNLAKCLLYPYVSMIHALSPIEADYIKQLLPEKPIYSLPQGPNILVWGKSSPSEELNERLPESFKGVKFVYVGRLDVFAKGLDILVEAFAQAVARLRGIDASLTLIGPDWDGGRSWLERRVAELNLKDQIVFAGRRSGSEVHFFLTQADIYIQLSRYEGFSLSVVEALLSGKPAILSKDIGVVSYPEIAELPHVSIVASLEQATNAILDCAYRLKDLKFLAKQNQQKIEDIFSWDRVAKYHLEMYEKALNAAVRASET